MTAVKQKSLRCSHNSYDAGCAKPAWIAGFRDLGMRS